MPENSSSISKRKKEHLDLCLSDKVSFRDKRNGFDNYEFKHYAITEVDISKIDFKTEFFGKKINYPFLISCMTGGTGEAEDINAQLAIAAKQLNIPVGVGSQRQALENKQFHQSYKIIRKNAPGIPVIGNIGGSQLVKHKSLDKIKYIAGLIEADAMAVHLNPLQELMQEHGEPVFKGFLKGIEKLIKYLDIPVIVKEVGAGISKSAAYKLLNAGVQGIDVAGAGGTSWAGVEILRNNDDKNDKFWDWGLPTSYCIRTVSKLKDKYDFTLIGSGGIYDGFDIAKSLALGADITASARIILQELNKSGIEGVVKLIENWFETVKKIMFLTGSGSVSELNTNKIIRKEKYY
ncbi:MAG: type 2 isopentenyl-diphosphate Delta-isomerase [Ignavibacteriaceae bacterium]|nr:type 2 isopentenyl-diphosphate Delta-isomerase [Ignavibacteriaceae bacterium]